MASSSRVMVITSFNDFSSLARLRDWIGRFHLKGIGANDTVGLQQCQRLELPKEGLSVRLVYLAGPRPRWYGWAEQRLPVE